MSVVSIPDLRIDPSEALDLYHSLRAAMVDVIVGPKPSQRFTVHEGLLRSNLREYAFERLVEEAQDGHKCIVLEDHSLESFKVYVNWLYRRRIPIPVQAVMTSSEEDFIQDEYVELAKAYSLGSELSDFDFMDAVTDAFMVRAFTKDSKERNWAPGSETINLIKGTSRFRAIEFFGDLYIRFGNHDRWYTEMANVCETFAHGLAGKLLECRKEGKNGNGILKDACKYHFHSNGPCYRAQLAPEYMDKDQEEN
ncbi:BTB/POZ-like protein [Metarhizium guizhouense ARSEF 977]|uniref:BTB/POZ-like protein n=1 Tax=Metarhizium guizhouense (strain ARSEF 977) TaxID=1276136 RepID=A0A0B4H827_METGA|nr:BTB/POZ-like protein [Metarhizium guizhouense ARSEF 977]